jgi:hypothetical protein
MTAVASIINSALRETNLIPLGVTPNTDQMNEGFGLLSTIVAGVLGNEAGENIIPFPLGQEGINSPQGYPWWANELPGNMYIPSNVRLMLNLTAAGTVNLDPHPHDGARIGLVDVSKNLSQNNFTINGNGRMIEGNESMIYNTDGEIREWMYREDLGNWVVVLPLDIAGDMPFPPEFDDMFIITLATRLNPRYGQIMHPASVQTLREAMRKFSARYKQAWSVQPSEDGLLFLTMYNRFYGRAFNRVVGDPNAYFNAGFPY